jgi:outer membrane protein OmpA-like peptidoglycan-associated protein
VTRSIRVVSGPIQRSRDSQPVLGLTLSLERHGPANSLVRFEQPKPAKITFTAACFEKALAPEDEREERDLGVLAGQLSVEGGSVGPLFSVVLADSTGIGAPADDAGDGPPPRRIRVALSDSFVLGDDDPNALFLEVPDDLADDKGHLELSVKLELDGATEAEPEVNDVLDLPLLPRPRVRVRLVDEVAKPLTGVELEFGSDAGSELVTTDGDGWAEVDDTGAESYTVSLQDPDAVASTLKGRWANARSGRLVGPTPNVAVRIFSDDMEPLVLDKVFTQTLSLQPPVVQARLLGMGFDTNKSFLLPSALPDLVLMKQLYDENPDSDLLIVGHTDATGEPSVNDPLSLERAESMAAYLKDDADTWLERYGTSVPEKRRWGSNEDFLMLSSLPDFLDRPEDEDPVSFFQRTRGLPVDGQPNEDTRRALIAEYMSRDETTLPDDVTPTTHGCGEFFPVDESKQPDESATPAADASDRRVELFFFSKEFGIQPVPPGKNSAKGSREYPEWRKRAKLALASELALSDRQLRVRLQLEGSPVANRDCAIDVDGRRLAIVRTEADGLVVQRLPQGAELAVLRVAGLNLIRSLRLTPAEDFPSADSVLGVQVRLRQLGFYAGTADGVLDDVTSGAIRGFKRSQALADNDDYDDNTHDALVKAYGS